MKLITQPDDGVTPLVRAIERATSRVDIVVFRFDLAELEAALKAAVARGVVVRALIAHTNRNGEQKLRQLEDRLLGYGATVDRTGADFVRYHGKLLDSSMPARHSSSASTTRTSMCTTAAASASSAPTRSW